MYMFYTGLKTITMPVQRHLNKIMQRMDARNEISVLCYFFRGTNCEDEPGSISISWIPTAKSRNVSRRQNRSKRLYYLYTRSYLSAAWFLPSSLSACKKEQATVGRQWTGICKMFPSHRRRWDTVMPAR